MKRLAAFLARAKDGVGRLATYVAIVNLLILIALLAPGIYGSQTINDTAQRSLGTNITSIAPFGVFLVALYALGALAGLTLWWFDHRFLRLRESGWANKFHPFAESPALNTAWQLAILHQSGVDVSGKVRQFAEDAATMGFREEFLAYYNAYLGKLDRIPHRDERNEPAVREVTR